MKRITAICLLSLLTLATVAPAEEGVRVVDRTTTSLAPNTLGHLELTSPRDLVFVTPGQTLTIPYASIRSFQYTKEVAHHLGVLPAIAVSLVKRRQRRHFFNISYADSSGALQLIVFEVPKTMPETLLADLQARASQACKIPGHYCGRS